MTQKLLLKRLKSNFFLKFTYGLSGNAYRVATLPKAYLTVIGIIIQSFKSTKDNSNMSKHTKRADLSTIK